MTQPKFAPNDTVSTHVAGVSFTGRIVEHWLSPSKRVYKSPRLIEVDGKQYWYYTIYVEGKPSQYVHRCEHELTR